MKKTKSIQRSKPMSALKLSSTLLALSLTSEGALIASYEFTAGSELVDSTTLTGNLTNVEGGAKDITFTGGYVSFQGSEAADFDYLSAPNFGLTASDAWSFQFDVRDPGGLGGPHPSAAGVISSNIGGGSDSWQLNSTTTAPGAIDETSSGSNNDGGADGAIIGDISDGNWHTILLVSEGDTTAVKAYFNGVQVNPTTLDWDIPRAGLQNMALGSNRGENIQASVDLDNVKVWNTAIPEPSSLLLLGLGAVMLGKRKR